MALLDDPAVRPFCMTTVLRRRLALSQKPNWRAKVVPIARDPEQFVFVKKNGAPIVSFTKR